MDASFGNRTQGHKCNALPVELHGITNESGTAVFTDDRSAESMSEVQRAYRSIFYTSPLPLLRYNQAASGKPRVSDRPPKPDVTTEEPH
ncbi:unnamed protein product [Boreogadus saida]